MSLNSSVTSRLAVLTPADALLLSTKFFAPSKVDQKLVRAYADDMRAGRWLANGASIVLTADGRVLDGRVRILACIQAKCPFETLIVEGVEPSAFETIDAVRKRTLADVLSIRRIPNGRALGAALRVIWAYLTGSIGGSRTPSSITLLDLIENHPEIRDSVVPSLQASPLLPHGSGIALHYLFGLVNSAKSDAFFARLSEDIAANPQTPIGHLRRVLEDMKQRGGSRKQAYVVAVTIKAWNAFASEKELKLLRYDPDREPFPAIAGLKDHPHGASGAGPLFDAPKPMHGHGSRSELSAQVELIGPETAEKFLAANSLNRRISGVVVDKYARDMREGRWQLNGQTIKIGASGKLLDGQHRLEAVKKAGRPFLAIVVRGVSETTFGSLDVGRRRGMNEVLRDRGEASTTVLASALRWLWMLKHQVVLAANSSPTNGEMLELLEVNPGIRNSLKFTSQIREIMGGGMASALHHTFSRNEASAADEFFSRLIDGVGLSATNPVYHLRERLLKTRASYRQRMSEAERVALSIKAWNAFKEQRPLQLLIWRNRGVAREALPGIL